jgi:hypothetical protein
MRTPQRKGWYFSDSGAWFPVFWDKTFRDLQKGATYFTMLGRLGGMGYGGGAIFETLKIFTTLFYCFSIISPVFWPNVRLNLPNFLLPSCPCPVRLCLYYFYWVSYSALPYFVSLNTRLWTIISSSIFVSPRWWKKKRRNTEQTDANNGYLFIYLKFFIHGSLSTSVLLKIYRVFW